MGTVSEAACPRCKVRIPADMPLCPFCKQPVAPVPEQEKEKDLQGIDDIRDLLVPEESFPGLKRFYRNHGKWVKLLLPVLVAIPVLWIGASLATRLHVEIPEDPVFPIEAEQVRERMRTVMLKGTVTNLGEDVPDLSLRSVGVTAEIRWGDGKVEKRRIFPKSPFRGEGALFHGETGTFEVDVPEGADSVTLRAGVVNLGEDRQFNLPLQRTLPRQVEE